MPASAPIVLANPGLPDLGELIALLQRVEQLLQGQLQMPAPLPNGKLKPKGKTTFQHPPSQSMQSGRQNR